MRADSLRYGGLGENVAGRRDRAILMLSMNIRSFEAIRKHSDAAVKLPHSLATRRVLVSASWTGVVSIGIRIFSGQRQPRSNKILADCILFLSGICGIFVLDVWESVSMDKHEKEFANLLEKSGAVFLRKRRHVIYRLPSGGNLVCSATPSSWRAARQRVRDLKRILHAQASASVVSEGPQLQTPESEAKRLRMHQPIPDAESRAEVHIPALGRPAAERNTDRPIQKFFIENVPDLIDAAEATESWRRLDFSAQIRVLRKIGSQFAHVEAATVRYAVTSDKELMFLQYYPWFTPEYREISPDVQATQSKVAQRSPGWRPALVIDDPIEGRLLLEIGSNELFGGAEKIFVTELGIWSGYDWRVFNRLNVSGEQIIKDHPWRESFFDDETEQRLFFMVFLPSAAAAFQIQPTANAGRDKSSMTTREAIRDILDTFQSIALQRRSPPKNETGGYEALRLFASAAVFAAKNCSSQIFRSHSH